MDANRYPHYLVYDAPSRGDFLGPAIEAVMRARVERVERELRDFGECLWTARDTVEVVNMDGLLIVRNKGG